MTESVERIKAARLVAIIRLKRQSAVADVIDALVEGGIAVLEVTSNTPGFGAEVSAARKKYPEVLIGAGTVKNAGLAKEAVAAGAQFLVTPNVSEAVVKVAHSNGVPVLMGALTPTEVNRAVECGADLIKVFPAAEFGASYFKSLQGPFDDVGFVAVGGVKPENAEKWFAAGAIGIGVGSGLSVEVNTPAEKKVLAERARACVEKIALK